MTSEYDYFHDTCRDRIYALENLITNFKERMTAAGKHEYLQNKRIREFQSAMTELSELHFACAGDGERVMRIVRKALGEK